MADEMIRLREFDSRDILPLITRAPGTYIQQLAIVGNSFISKLFILAIDPGATVTVTYHDFGVGGDRGEVYPLPSHAVQTTDSLVPDKILVTNFNDKPVVTAVVSGGSATFGVYITVVTASSTDIDNALQRERDQVDLTRDKGLPTALFDASTGEWFFARGLRGVQDVRLVDNVTLGEPGTPLFLDYQGETTPGLEQTLIGYTVPAGFKLNLLAVILTTTFSTQFEILGDGSLVGSGRTAPGNPQVNFAYRIARTFNSGKIVEIKATTRAGAPIDAIECYLQGTLSLA